MAWLQVDLYVALSNVFLLPLPMVPDSQQVGYDHFGYHCAVLTTSLCKHWDTRRQKYREFMDPIVTHFQSLPLQADDANVLQSVHVVVKIFQALVANLKGEPKNAKAVMHEVIQVRITGLARVCC